MNPKPYLIVSDGACSKNPGPGGWGLIVVTPTEQVYEWGGHESETTNNRMELMGFYRGLQEVYRISQNSKVEPDQKTKVIRIISDSKYVLDGAEKFIHAWKKNGWMTTAGTEVKNQDLWEKILKGIELLRNLSFRFEYELVKGHSGHEGNERVDQIAVRYSKNEPIELYQGSLKDYSLDLNNKEPFTPVYLSYVDGKLLRHETWDECKAATDGKKGAKYKKVKNRLEEQEILRLWGL